MTGPNDETIPMPATWVPFAAGSAYDVDNLPYAVFTQGDDEPRVGARIGDFVLDLAPLASIQMVDGTAALVAPSLLPFMATGPATWRSVRSWIQRLLADAAEQPEVEPFLIRLDQVETTMPFEVADYVDFYCSIDHASNVGAIFRPDSEPLTPNWRHLPIGYHGRSGTVVPSGTPIVRPSGQRRRPGESSPTFGPSERLDIEAELGFVVGCGSTLGTPVAASAFADHVFGVTLLNDWSARDIQAWEYVPLGPFLGKSFATSISPWVTPLEALETARRPLPEQDPAPLDYLRVDDPVGYDIDVAVTINGTVVSRPPYASMYWSPAQMLAHMTVNGASLRSGDLYGSGTISGAEPNTRGSLLELSWGGRDRLMLDDGTTRTFLEDGDTVTLTATAPGALGGRIALGEVTGRIGPSDMTGGASGRPDD